MNTQPSPDAGIDLALRIGQHVRHRDHNGQRVTGFVRGFSIQSDNTLQVDIVLDAPIVIPASDNHRRVDIWHQHVPAHELSPFDHRDELVEEMLQALQGVVRVADRQTAEFDAARAAIAKARNA